MDGHIDSYKQTTKTAVMTLVKVKKNIIKKYKKPKTLENMSRTKKSQRFFLEEL